MDSFYYNNLVLCYTRPKSISSDIWKPENRSMTSAAILKRPRTNTVKLVISLGRQFGSKAIQCCSCIYLFVFVQFSPIMYSEGHFRKKKKEKKFYIKSSKVSSNIVSPILIQLHIKTLFQHQLSFDEYDPPPLSFHLL